MNRLLPFQEILSPVDTAWLRMEEPTNLMMVTGVMTFAAPIPYDALYEVIERRLLRFGRFRQKVVESRLPLGAPTWVDDPAFDLRYHLRRVALPAPGDQATLQEMVSSLASTPLDYSKPLWQMHLVEGVGDGCAVVSRLHHCIADGMALMYVLLSMTDMTPDPQVVVEEAEEPRQARGLVDVLFDRAATAVRLTNRATREGLSALQDPEHAVALARQGLSGATTTARLLLRSPDPKTVFKGPLGVSKSVAWSRAIPLAEVKTIRRATASTVNDVLLTAMTGALRRYMQARGDAPDSLNFRAAVPVNLRQPDEMGELGNKFGLVFLALPVDIADPRARLAKLKQRMDKLKATPEATIAFGILTAMGLSAREVQRLIVEIMGTKITAVMTNVPGPPIPLYLAGQAIDDIMFWVPQSGRAGLGISILSYAGRVYLGVFTDSGLVPDPDAIIDAFYQEFDALKALAAPPAAPATCRATTKAGRPCRNWPREGSLYCHRHQPD